MWVRGLKRIRLRRSPVGGWSYPVWVRGLKLPMMSIDLSAPEVVPRVGAWIETFVKRKLFHKRYTYLRDEVYLLWDLKCSSATKGLVLRKNNFLKSLTLTYNFA